MEPLILPYYSYTLVSAMQKCPMAVRLARFDRLDDGSRLPRGVGMWNVGGNAFHSAVREWEAMNAEHVDATVNGYPTAPAPTPDEAAERWRHHFTEEIVSTTLKSGMGPDKWKVAQRGRETREWWLDKGPEMMATYVEQQQYRQSIILPLDDDALALELGLLTAPDVFGVPVKMFLDQAHYYPKTHDIEVRDLKTGRIPHDPLQLQTYGVALAHTPALLPDQVRNIYGSNWDARKGDTTPAISITKVDHNQTNYRYKAAAAAIARRDFEPRPTMLCGSCDVRAYCPIMGNEATMRPLTLPAQDFVVEIHDEDESLTDH